ncbi:MAG TPA: hypothetical protein VL134_10725 [Leptolyngbya sp.]|nr:hypothetical protein [Leptolyngbya sp.]
MSLNNPKNNLPEALRETLLPVDESIVETDSADPAVIEANRLLKVGIELYQRGELPAAIVALKKAHILCWELGNQQGSKQALE